LLLRRLSCVSPSELKAADDVIDSNSKSAAGSGEMSVMGGGMSAFTVRWKQRGCFGLGPGA
jgi:hypothetical protein